MTAASRRSHAAAPTLVTERLVLRMPRLEDFEPFAAFFETDRSRFEDGPMTREGAWRIFASEVALWPLMGFGPFSLECRVTGRYLGEVGIYQPAHFPETEIGWILMAEAEGKGYAHEAARRVLAFAWDELGLPSLVNYIAPENARSIALGLRLGGAIEPGTPGSTPTDVVIRHRPPERAAA
jgi:RimJ/RimL family protein N-acetyltransferase